MPNPTMVIGNVNMFFLIDRTKLYDMMRVMSRKDQKFNVVVTSESQNSINCLDNGSDDYRNGESRYTMSQNIGGHMAKEGCSRGNCGATRGVCGGCACHNKDVVSSDSRTGNSCNSKKMLVFIPAENSGFSKVIVKPRSCSRDGKGCCGNCSRNENKKCSVTETTNEAKKC